jgi:hypothetical protein
MARRGGKAANRRDRQRRAKQRSAQRGPVQGRPLPGAVSEAIEAAAEQRAVAAEEQVRQPAPARAAPRRTGRADPRFTISGPSRLSEGAAAEYHYVMRDVRNIGVLVAVMGVLLIAAVLLFHALGLGTA